jgi:hypothetical protein
VEDLPAWCNKVGVLAADALVDHGMIAADALEKAAKIVATEILVRVSMGDRPPA